MDETRKITEANRAAWNEVTPIHQKNRKIDLKAKFAEPGYSYLDPTETAKLQEIGLEGKKVAQLSCNNGREIISVVNLGAAEGVGFDISDEVIREAEELASIAKANCRFVRTDVYDIGEEWHGYFDLVYVTIGALAWLPDLDRYFAVVASILKPGGSLLIYEQHPFGYMMAVPDEPEWDEQNPVKVCFSYFRTEPWVDNTGIDYVGKSQYEAKPSYCYTQKLSDILNPMVRHGMELLEFNEYSHDVSTMFPHLEPLGLMPLCYLLIGRKK